MFGLLENTKIKYIWTTTPTEIDQSSLPIVSLENKRNEKEASVDISYPKDVSGEYYLVVIPVDVRDINGNAQTNITISNIYKLDNTSPTCGEDNGTTNWSNKTRTITVECEDEHSGCKKTAFPKKFSTTMDISAITIIDKVGNTSDCPVNVYVDKTPPTCSVSGGNDSWTNQNVTVTATCEDEDSGCKQSSFSKTYTENASYNKKAGAVGFKDGGIVEDNAGNTATCPANQTVKIDKTAPTCNVSGGSNAWTNGSRTITATCTDSGGSGCQANISHTYTSNTNTTSAGANGNNSGGIVKDNAGNTTTCPANQTVKIDKTAPTCSVSGGSNAWTNGSRTITATCTDFGGSGCRQNSFSYTYTNDINTTTAGANGNNSGGIVKDNAGNETLCPANQTVKIKKGTAVYQTKYTINCSSYYITTCDTSDCTYTKKNGITTSGTVRKKYLYDYLPSSCSNQQFCYAYINKYQGTRVSYYITKKEQCKIKNIIGDRCSISNITDYTFTANFNSIASGSSCLFTLTAYGTTLYTNDGIPRDQIQWPTIKCTEGGYCTDSCPSYGCASSGTVG